MKIDIVISRYNEKIDWISDLNPEKFNIFIYDKGEKHPEFESIQLSNFGREGETYLYHIINNYHNLGEYTIFLQGNPLEHLAKLIKHGFEDITSYCDYRNYDYAKCSKALASFLNDLDPDYDFYEIGDIHSDLGYLDERNKLINELNLNKTVTYFTPGAQFIVNKKIIKDKPLEFWKKIHGWFLPNNGEFCDITFAYIMERLWVTIFKTKNK